MDDNKLTSDLKEYFKAFYASVFGTIDVAKTLNIDLDKLAEKRFHLPENSKLRLFGSQKIKESFTIYSFKDTDSYKLIEKVFNYLDENVRSRSDLYGYIEAFGNLLIWAEEILLFENDEESYRAWSKRDDDKMTLTVFFNLDDTLVTVNFQKSAINMPGSSDDNPLDFMNNPSPKYATFIDIKISRSFGNNIESNITAILGSDMFSFNDDEVWMLDLIENKICSIMKDMLLCIHLHILRNCCNIKNLSVEDFIDGTTIRA